MAKGWIIFSGICVLADQGAQSTHIGVQGGVSTICQGGLMGRDRMITRLVRVAREEAIASTSNIHLKHVLVKR